MHQDAVDPIVIVEFGYPALDLFRRGFGGQDQLAAHDPQPLAHPGLHADVGRRRRIVPNEDNGQACIYARLLEARNFYGDFVPHRRRYLSSVDKSCCHMSVRIR